MSKKYLSLEEAAAIVGVDKAEMNRLREKGLIRAFADRGNWKFKEEDVENLARNRQFDSDPDVAISSESGSQIELATGDSSGELIFSDDDILGQQPTIISKNKASEDSSESDVRLIFDDVPASKKGGGDASSDSDVRLAGSTGNVKPRSDSDVRLVSDDSSSGVKPGSDSDVRLVSSESSSEIAIPALGSSDDLPAVDGGSSNVFDDDGISLAEDSSAPLGGDSGISLERPNDSGISLSDESSIILTGGDSGISLALEDDDGISLSDVPAAKPAKKPAAKPAAKAPSDDELSGTIPLLDGDSLFETDNSIPLLDPSSGDIETAKGNSTSVITLDDDVEEFQLEEDNAAVLEEDEAVVTGDLVGEDDEIAEDVFGAEDDDFDDGLMSGESSSDLAAPRIVAPVEQEWDAGTLIGLSLSTLVMTVVGILMFDMVRNMWHADVNARNPMASALLDMFK